MPVADDPDADPGAGILDVLLQHLATFAFSPLRPPARIGLAVSGGGDSIAMLHLMTDAARNAGWQVRAVTVDHQLRPESAQEAQFVARVCEGLGVPHDVVLWDHGQITGNVMDRARRARYQLIAQWARGHDIGHVTLAHTATDQAETFLMGLSRAAGLDGLSGMRPHFNQDDVLFARPFLQLTRADLRRYLARHHLAWVEDPTNDNEQYTRVKARRALKALAPLGITEERLASTVHHLALAQSVVRRAAADAALSVVAEVAGSLRIDRAAFRGLGPELERRVLILCLTWLTQNDYPPRAAGIERLSWAIAQRRDATLAGCRLVMRDSTVLIAREPKDLGGPVALGQIWDGRWRVDGPDLAGSQVHALGAAGLAACKDWRDLQIPREALIATPSLWQGGRLVAAPLVQSNSDWSATLSQSFNQFILSH